MHTTRAYPALYLAAGLLACVLAVGTCVWHKFRGQARTSDYLIGAGAWIVSVAAKVALALVVFLELRRVFGDELPPLVSIPATGLLTGMTECVLVLLLARRRRWREAHWDSQVALGLGFGCFEALALGAPLALAGFASQWLDAEDARSLQAAFSDPQRPFTFLWERTIAVPVHVLACVLILRSVRVGRPSLFCWGFLLKSAIDAVPVGRLPELLVEVIYALFGVASTLAFLRLATRWRAEGARAPGIEASPAGDGR